MASKHAMPRTGDMSHACTREACVTLLTAVLTMCLIVTKSKEHPLCLSPVCEGRLPESRVWASGHCSGGLAQLTAHW